MGERIYAAIDLKSFYASVECAARELDPMTTNLVVADARRTEKTICLAVSPSLKKWGIPGRPRLFEVSQRIAQVNALRRCAAPGRTLTGKSWDAPTLERDGSLAVDYIVKKWGIPGRPRLFEVSQRIAQVNALRRCAAPGRTLTGKSWDAPTLERDNSLAVDYIVAPPRMSYYMECSSMIYNVYLKYIAPEDIHVYSIDEVFIDLTGYLKTYGCTPRELVMRMIRDVLETSGVTATAGIGTNLYLCKVAMDIVAKHIPADENGVRIAQLDELEYRRKLWDHRPLTDGTNLYLCKVAMDIVAKHIPADENGVRIAQLDELEYRRKLWDHRPLTDFWRVGRGYSAKLESHGMFTMGDVARCSMEHEDLLYRLFGVNAELLIDHAWGWEPCTMADIRAYKPRNSSVSAGQVLSEPSTWERGRLIVREMADLMALDLVDKGLTTDQLVLTVGYDIANLRDPGIRSSYRGELIVREMADLMALDLVDKGLTTDQLVLTVGYDIANLRDPGIRSSYRGDITRDAYGREVPKHAHGTVNLPEHTASTMELLEAVTELYERITAPDLLIRRLTYGREVPKHAHGTVNLPEHTASTMELLEAVTELYERITAPDLLIRRLTLCANRLAPEQSPGAVCCQMDLFASAEENQRKAQMLEREKRRQQAMLDIRRRYGKNAIVKGMNLEEGATAMERNRQIGGHQA